MGEDGELDALRRILRRVDVDGVIVGAIASDYQHARVNRIADEVGLRVFAPLWRRDPTRLVHDYLEAGFDIAFSSVSAEGLDASWLGRRWDDRVIQDLLHLQQTRGVHPCGEGGEFETLVLDAPPFEQSIDVVRATPDWHGTAGGGREDATPTFSEPHPGTQVYRALRAQDALGARNLRQLPPCPWPFDQTS